MMFLILDRDPIKSVQYLVENSPRRFYSKQLIELGQLICSAGISNVYKPLGNGKAQQIWIAQHPDWTLIYYRELFQYCTDKNGFNYRIETLQKFDKIAEHLSRYANGKYYLEPDTAIWRYSDKYRKYAKHPSNVELPIDYVVALYRNYLAWKVDYFRSVLHWKFELVIERK